jgi:hypothetical protein
MLPNNCRARRITERRDQGGESLAEHRLASGSLPFLGNGSEWIQQVAGGSRQAVEPRHHQHVAGFKRLDRAAKRAGAREEVRFADDSPLEGAGFELLVPGGERALIGQFVQPIRQLEAVCKCGQLAR